jgi:hypothetical protein
MTVVALSLCLTGGALAAAPKPPKTACWQLGILPDWLTIVTKPAGATVKMSDGPMKFYNVGGEFTEPTTSYSVPVAGTGHMKGNVFHFSVSGAGLHQGTVTSVLALGLEGEWDVSTGAGTMNYWFSNGATGTEVLNPQDCTTTQVIPKEGSGATLTTP